MSEETPQLFISYSWTNEEHEQWVLDLATELRENGIDVILDKWDLKEGHDSYAFMEKMVSDSDVEKVILVCDQKYAEKANNREGGVGTETQIITPELYSEQEQDKFVAVVKERDSQGEAYLPTFYKSRIYIDLSTEENYGNNFERLLRWVYGQPLNKKPDLGNKPAYLEDEKHIQLGTSSRHRRVINAIKSGKSIWTGALDEYYSVFAENLEEFRMDTEEGEIDEQLIENIEEFIPYRNELIQLFSVLGKYEKDSKDAYELTHDFFEKILVYNDRTENITSHRESAFDNFRFISHELFLYANAIFLKNHAFDFVNHLLSQGYYLHDPHYGKSDLCHFKHIFRNVKSLERRKRRTNSNSISIRADLLKKRSGESGVSFNKLMETDFILFLRSILDEEQSYYWWPTTLVYASRFRNNNFELFARSKSKTFFDNFKTVLGIEKKDELDDLIEKFNTGDLKAPRVGNFPLRISSLANAENIASRS